ncbi:MAG: hypothetical protein AAFN42_08840 [Cyanobacteria bacterium J06554_1]
MVSLKRTLLSDLASSIEVLNPINQELSKSNLHTPLRYSAVLLSIGKTTHICHQNIPLKKIDCKETVVYSSAISRKLEKTWRQPVGEIASKLLTVLQAQATPSVWSSVRKDDDGWIEFVISQWGIEQWRQQLMAWTLSTADKGQPCFLEAKKLWQLQSGYELCCRWQSSYQQHMGGAAQRPTETISSAVFCMGFYPLHQLIHRLLDICDGWDEATPSQLLQMASRLVLALEQCTDTTRLSSPNAAGVNRWLIPTQIVLKQLLDKRLGYQLTERF